MRFHKGKERSYVSNFLSKFEAGKPIKNFPLVKHVLDYKST